MNKIINMVMRLVMRKMLSKGIDAGFNKASSMRAKPQRPLRDDTDGGAHPRQGGPTQQEIRAARRANRQNGGQGAKQAKQALKVVRRAGKL